MHRKGEASGLRNSAAWAEVTALVDLAHAAARGAAHGGSGEKAEHLLPRDEAEGRTIYVLEYTREGKRTAVTFLADKLQNEAIQKMRINAHNSTLGYA